MQNYETTVLGFKLGDVVIVTNYSKEWDGLGVVEGFYSNRDVSINFCHRVGYFNGNYIFNSRTGTGQNKTD